MSNISGKWQVTLKTPVGDKSGVLTLKAEGSTLSGSLSDGEHHAAIEGGRVEGNHLSWTAQIEKPMRLKFKFTAEVAEDRIRGEAKHMLGTATFEGRRA
jgi:hypothetical protein